MMECIASLLVNNITMQVIHQAAPGAPLSLATVAIPTASKGHLVLKQQYSSFNPIDQKLFRFNIFNTPYPLTFGRDVSGIVYQVGEGVTKFKVGDAVFGRAVMNGGGFGQYVDVPEEFVVKRVNLPADVAGAAAVAFVTSYNPLFLEDNLNNRKGQTIFIAGGGGGVGHVAVQLAKRAGLKVIASAGKPESLQLAKESGADHVIDYSKNDVVAEVLKLTNNEGVDLAFDPTYVSSSFVQSAKTAKKGGKWIRVGGVAWNHGGADDTEARKVCEQRGVEAATGDASRYSTPEYASRVHELVEMYELCDKLYLEGLKIEISKVVPLDPVAINEVFTDSEKGKVYGKVVIEIEKQNV